VTAWEKLIEKLLIVQLILGRITPCHANDCGVCHLSSDTRSLSGSVVKVLDTRPKGPRFNSQPVPYHIIPCLHDEAKT